MAFEAVAAARAAFLERIVSQLPAPGAFEGFYALPPPSLEERESKLTFALPCPSCQAQLIFPQGRRHRTCNSCERVVVLQAHLLDGPLAEALHSSCTEERTTSQGTEGSLEVLIVRPALEAAAIEAGVLRWLPAASGGSLPARALREVEDSSLGSVCSGGSVPSGPSLAVSEKYAQRQRVLQEIREAAKARRLDEVQASGRHHGHPAGLVQCGACQAISASRLEVKDPACPHCGGRLARRDAEGEEGQSPSPGENNDYLGQLAVPSAALDQCRLCGQWGADGLLSPCGHGGLCASCFRNIAAGRKLVTLTKLALAHAPELVLVPGSCPFCRRRVALVSQLIASISAPAARGLSSSGGETRCCAAVLWRANNKIAHHDGGELCGDNDQRRLVVWRPE